MKKLSTAAIALVAVLGITTSALATGEVYSNAGSKISPAKSGTKKAPKPVVGTTIFNISNPNGNRPDVVTGYKIGLGEGITDNSGLFPKCSQATIETPSQGPSKCPKGSKLGTGVAYNLAGAPADPTSKIECDLGLTLFNGGKGKVLLVVQSQAPLVCPLTVPPTVIPATLAKVGGILTLSFVVQNALVHPAGLDNALYKTTAKFGATETIKKKVGGTTKKVKIGYIQAISCPKTKKRTLKTTFTTEAGVANTATTTSPCTS